MEDLHDLSYRLTRKIGQEKQNLVFASLLYSICTSKKKKRHLQSKGIYDRIPAFFFYSDEPIKNERVTRLLSFPTKKKGKETQTHKVLEEEYSRIISSSLFLSVERKLERDLYGQVYCHL